jgi:hypothetical protein
LFIHLHTPLRNQCYKLEFVSKANIVIAVFTDIGFPTDRDTIPLFRSETISTLANITDEFEHIVPGGGVGSHQQAQTRQYGAGDILF